MGRAQLLRFAPISVMILASGGVMEIALAVVGVILAAIGFVEHYD